MIRIGLIRERKTPPDTRVALTPQQCRHILDTHSHVDIVVDDAYSISPRASRSKGKEPTCIT